MTPLDHLVGYALVCIIWAAFCLTFSHIVAEDKTASRNLIRGFWLTPIWPLVIAFGVGYVLRFLWDKAEWGK